MTLGKIVQLIVASVFAVIFLWLVGRYISFEELTSAFDKAKPGWILAATVVFFVGYAFRIERWRLMLVHDNSRLTWLDCVGPFLASVAANNVLPFRAGDIIRVVCFNKRLGITVSVSVTTLMMERAMDLVVLLFLLSFTLLIFDLNIYSLIGITSLLLGSIALIFLILLLFPNILRIVINRIEEFICRFLPKRQGWIVKQIRSTDDLLLQLSKNKLMAKLIGWSALAWIAEGCVFWCAAIALPSVSKPISAWLALPVGTLSTVIPSTPGFIGTFDYFTSQSMVLMGNELAASAAYAFTVHAIIWFPPTILGGIYIFLNPISFTKTLELSKNG
jgi:uncharacterized protein (TIRG00374 family)